MKRNKEAGKGDKYRKVDITKWCNNYEAISWDSKKQNNKKRIINYEFKH